MKKKIFKKLLAGALTAVMAFSLTACGGGGAGSNSSSGSKQVMQEAVIRQSP